MREDRDMGARARAGKLKLGLLCAIAGMLALPSLAQAELSFCPAVGEGAGQCANWFISDPGSNSKAIPQPAVATDFETGRVYVADDLNHRINVFKPDGTFLFAFGWGVDTGASKLETCTTASGCQKGIQGTGAGQFSSPDIISVDNTPGSPSRHGVYVATRGTGSRVQKFEPDGTFLLAFGWGVDTGASKLETCTTASGCQAGIAGPEAGQLNQIAGIGVTPSGEVDVLDNRQVGSCPTGGTTNAKRLETFSASGTLIKVVDISELPLCGSLRSLAVDSAGSFYSISEGNSNYAFRKFTSEGAVLCTGEGNSSGVENSTLTVDVSDHLFVSQKEAVILGGIPGRDPSSNPSIIEYDSNCNPLRRFSYPTDGKKQRRFSLAAYHSGEGDIFSTEEISTNIVESGGIHYISISPPGPIIHPLGFIANPVGNTKATIKAEVNPEGKATDVYAEYVDDAHFQEGGLGFASPATKKTAAVSLNVPAGHEFRMNLAEVPIGCPTATKALIEEGMCLTPETTYHYRVIATNEDNPTGKGEGTVVGKPFTTKEPIEINESFATEVGTDAATLSARVNPLGIPATGYFEYVDDATYQASGFAEATKVPDVDADEAAIDFGSAEEPTKRSVTPYPLPPGTTYHYRLVVTNPLIEGVRMSAEKTFRTQVPVTSESCPVNEAFRTGASALLPDCRAYEMVSPVDKDNGDIVVQTLGNPAGVRAVLEQSAISGDRLAYGAERAFGDAASAPYTSQYIAAREPGVGWSNHGISPPKSPISISASVVVDFGDEFRAFSDDLCEGWLMPLSDPPLAEGAVAGYFNLYRRTDELCGGESFETITASKPENFPSKSKPLFNAVELQGRSADGSAAAFASTGNMEGGGAPPQSAECTQIETVACSRRLYVEASGQAMRYACVLPDGEALRSPCSAGFGGGYTNGNARNANVTNAFSADGKRLYWSTSSENEGKIYLRVNPLEAESAHLHSEAVGIGDLNGPVSGTGNLAKSLTTVKKAKATSGAFAVGQEITAPEGIPAGTTIVKIEETEPETFTLTLSKAATATQAGAELSVAATEFITSAKAQSGAFAVGQEIRAPQGGIPDGTTITKVEESKPSAFKLTLSAKVTAYAVGATLRTTSKCTEADKACTIPVSRDAEQQSGASGSHYWTAAKDGSRAIFTTRDYFLREADLYEFDLAGEATHRIAGGVYGLLGASEDASRVYFVSSEVLTGEEQNSSGDKAVAGKPNLYLYEAGAGGGYSFIATLRAADLDFYVTNPISGALWKRRSRVSPDGLHAAFLSTVSLTGYDNTDAASPEACGEPKGVCDYEAFVYDAASSELRCVSCNPSGARPAGMAVDDIRISGDPVWIAAKIPAYENIFYGPRILSDDGSRLFFESADALVARDTNGHIDVYQWERAGTGTCDEGDVTYSEAAGGCIDLISSGQSNLDSRLVDADSDGSDVFFTTSSSLVPQDYGLVDIYDARVDGGLPSPSQPPAACEGEACQSAPEPPNDPTPASESFQGAGNVREESSTRKPPPCAKGKVRRHGKCVAKKHRKHRAKHKRRSGR